MIDIQWSYGIAKRLPRFFVFRVISDWFLKCCHGCQLELANRNWSFFWQSLEAVGKAIFGGKLFQVLRFPLLETLWQSLEGVGKQNGVKWRDCRLRGHRDFSVRNGGIAWIVVAGFQIREPDYLNSDT